MTNTAFAMGCTDLIHNYLSFCSSEFDVISQGRMLFVCVLLCRIDAINCSGIGVVGFAIFCFMLYWDTVIVSIGIGIAFLFWTLLFTCFFNEPYIAFPCAVIATGLTLWAFGAYGERSDKNKASGDS
jgi:hypothetical protein